MTHFPVPKRARVRRLYPGDRRLKMHPRVQALARIIQRLPDDGTEAPLPAEYRRLERPTHTACEDWRRLRAAIWPQWVVRFTAKTVRRTA